MVHLAHYRPRARLAAALALSLLAAGCDDSPAAPPATTGVLHVQPMRILDESQVGAGNVHLLIDGVEMDGTGIDVAVPPGTRDVYQTLPPGQYTLRYVGLSEYCVAASPGATCGSARSPSLPVPHRPLSTPDVRHVHTSEHLAPLPS